MEATATGPWSVKVTWQEPLSPNGDVTQYKITITDGGGSILTDTVAGDEFSYETDLLSPSTNYVAKIQAITGNIIGAGANDSATTLDLRKLILKLVSGSSNLNNFILLNYQFTADIQVTAIGESSSTIDVNWIEITGATHYEVIWYTLDGLGQEAFNVTSQELSAVLINLKSFTSYEIEVSAYLDGKLLAQGIGSAMTLEGSKNDQIGLSYSFLFF